MPLSEHVYCVAITSKMTEWGEQRICIKFCVKLEHSCTETIWMIQKATAILKQLVIGSFIMTTCPLIHHGLCRVFWWNIKSPRFGTLRLLAFPKTKITFEREQIAGRRWDPGKYEGAADGNWENSVRSQGAYFEGDWGIIDLCTMFLVSSSISVSIFHITWLDSFWTDLV